MRFKKGFIFGLFLLLNVHSGTSRAAVAPYYQSLKELKDLLLLPEIEEQIGSNYTIEQIRRTGYGYEITSGGCILPIDMKYLPSPLLGPLKYVFTVRYINCQRPDISF